MGHNELGGSVRDRVWNIACVRVHDSVRDRVSVQAWRRVVTRMYSVPHLGHHGSQHLVRLVSVRDHVGDRVYTSEYDLVLKR